MPSNPAIIEKAIRDAINSPASRRAVIALAKVIAEQVWCDSEWEDDRAGNAATSIEAAIAAVEADGQTAGA